jgi:RimJ/RimL family protein N-acetyltransferase
MLTMRLATMEDWARLLAWRNDPETRANSVEQAEVTVSEHRKWLKKTLASPSTMLFVFTDNSREVVVGTGRLDFDAKHKSIELSLTIDPRQRGRGYAGPVIQMLADAARYVPEGAYTRLVALVRPGNVASLRAFARCGFVPCELGKAANQQQLVELERPL